MKKSKRINYFIIGLLLLNSFVINAQSVTKFIIKDSLSMTPLSYSSIKVYNKKRNSTTGGISDSLGVYSYKSNKIDSLIISASYVGFHPKSVKYIASDTTYIILLSPQKEFMDEILVKGKKALLEVMPDRTRLNINKTLESGKKIAETLRKLPFVVVTGDDILIKGKSNFRIFKDGVPSNLTIRDLRNMPSIMVKSIEIIYFPSSKYEGEVEQIINIITNKDDIYNGGTMWAGTGIRSGGIFNISTLGINTSSITPLKSSNFSFSISDDKITSNTQTEQFVNKNQYNQSVNSKSRSSDFNLGYSMAFQLPKSQSISLGIDSHFEPKVENADITTAPGAELRENKVTNHIWSLNLNANYSKIWKNKSAFYFSNLLQYGNSQYELNSQNESVSFYNQNKSKTLSYINQMDYSWNTFYGIAAEVGGAFILRHYSQNLNYQTGLLNDDLNYTQSIQGGYVSLTKKYQKIFLRIGTRVENTYNKSENDTSFNALNILPRALINYTLSKTSKISLSYSRRVQRPELRFLTKFRDVSNPLSLVYGNTKLQNELYDALSLNYTLSLGATNINLSAISTWGQNRISSIRTANDSQVLLTYFNVAKSSSYGLEYSINTSLLSDKLYIFSSGSLKEYKIEGWTFQNSGWLKSINLGFTFAPSDKVSIDIFGNMLSNNVALQVSAGNSFYMDCILNYRLSNNSTLTFRTQNPIIDKVETKYNTDATGIYISSLNHYQGRTIQVSYNHSFGRTKNAASRTKEIKVSDLKKEE